MAVQQTRYGFGRRVDLPYDQTVERVKAAQAANPAAGIREIGNRLASPPANTGGLGGGGRIVPIAVEHDRVRTADGDVPGFAGFQLVPFVTQNAYIKSGNRLCSRTRLDRKHSQSNTVGGNRPTRFGLPPVINNRHSKLMLRPEQSIWIAALTSQK